MNTTIQWDAINGIVIFQPVNTNEVKKKVDLPDVTNNLHFVAEPTVLSLLSCWVVFFKYVFHTLLDFVGVVVFFFIALYCIFIYMAPNIFKSTCTWNRDRRMEELQKMRKIWSINAKMTQKKQQQICAYELANVAYALHCDEYVWACCFFLLTLAIISWMLKRLFFVCAPFIQYHWNFKSGFHW